MNSPYKPRISGQNVLRAMTVGFVLVLLLLGLAGLVAVRGTASIESNTARVVKEQLLAARLLNGVQAEQDTLTAVLHELTRRPESLDAASLTRRLEETDAALERVMADAEATPESQLWRELAAKVRAFTAGARSVMAGRGSGGARLDTLFAIHDDAVNVVRQLLAASSRRVAQAETLIELESHELARKSSLLLGACFGLALLCALMTIAFSRWSIRQMEWQASELNRVSWHMLQSQESAARRFSHELHDELGQSLAAVKANLTAGDAHEFASRRADCLQLVDGAIANVRELSQLLRPVILDDFGLDAGLRWLTEKFAQRSGLVVQFDSNLSRRLADETETHLFRIAQEALTNVARHSGATRVKIELEESGERVWLRIEDNGRGFDEPATDRASLGLTGMRARAAQAGGELQIAQPKDGGVRIQVWVPAAGAGEDVGQENANTAG